MTELPLDVLAVGFTLLDFIESAWVSGAGVFAVVSVFKGGVGSKGDFFLGRCVCRGGGEEARLTGDEGGWEASFGGDLLEALELLCEVRRSEGKKMSV